MLRLLFVFSILIAGVCYALQGPFYALLFYMWNAYFRPESWVWNPEYVSVLNISYYLGVYVVLSSIFTGQKFRVNGHVILLILFALHTMLSLVFADHGANRWPVWNAFLKTLIFSYFIVVLVTDLNRYRLTIMVMTLSLGFEGAKQGYAQLVLNPGGINANRIPFLGDNNGVAIGMLMLVPLFASLGATTTLKWPRRIYRFLLVGVLYRALTTYSRGGFVACGALSLAYWWRSRQKVRVLAGMAIAAAIVLPVMPDEFWDRMNTILTYQEDEEGSALGRVHFWKVATAMADANPILGVGFSSFSSAYNKYDFSFGEFGEKRSVHSIWFGILGELGYLGLSIYVLMIACALLNCRRARNIARARGLEDLRKYAGGLETGLVVFCVGGTFLSFQYQEMLFHFMGLSIALRHIAEGMSPPAAGSKEDLRSLELALQK